MKSVSWVWVLLGVGWAGLTDAAPKGWHTDAPSCETLWHKRQASLKKTPLGLPSALQCPATHDLLLAYFIVNGRAQDCDLKAMLSWARRFPMWPHREEILPIIEAQLLKRGADPQILSVWFRQHGPQTTPGMVWYGTYLRKTHQLSLLHPTLSRFWVHQSLPLSSRETFWSMFQSELTPQDHRRRILHHVLAGNREQAVWTLKCAGRDLPRVTHRCVEAFRHKKSTSSMWAQTLSSWSSETPEYAYALVKALEVLRQEQKESIPLSRTQTSKAVSLLKAYDHNPRGALDSQVDHKLAQAREWVVRMLMMERRYHDALHLARSHGLSHGPHYVDHERLCGWLALRHLNAPQKALEHFQKALKEVTSTESWVDLQFWLGETYHALKRPQEAQKAYRQSARYGHMFYGQQAFLKISSPLKDYHKLPQPQVALKGFRTLAAQEERDLVRMLCQVVALKHSSLFQNFLKTVRHVRLRSSSLKRLKTWLDTHKSHTECVLAPKYLHQVHPDFHPSPSAYPHLGGSLKDLGHDISPDLWHGLIHRESSFDPTTRSVADARGLMQLRPATAAEMARSLRVSFKASDLFSRPDMNIKLGCAYLKRLHRSFPQAAFLALAAYNAGPSHVRGWMKTLGEPGKPLSALEWIESIPFQETRRYVKEVMANAHMYQYKRTGKFLPSSLPLTSCQAP